MTRQTLVLMIVIAALGVIAAACASAPTPAPTAAPPTAVPATTAPQPTTAPTAAATIAPATGAKNIPANHAGRAQCLVCHATGVGGAPKPPAAPDHTAFKDDVAFCTQCHQMSK